jgi:hypothetical protein
MTPEEFRKLAEQAARAAEANRRAVERLQQTPRWNELVRASVANARALQTATRSLERSPGYQRALEAAQEAVASPALRAALRDCCTSLP